MQPIPGTPSTSFATRLLTFQDQWPAHQTTARQLAALGHVCDRPPLECLEEGSRCIDCGHFLPMQTSVSALESSLVITNSLLTFHEPKCARLQLRMPLEANRSTLDYSALVSRWERRSHATPPTTSTSTPTPTLISTSYPQTSPLFALPTELRLQIYSYILPSVSALTEIVFLNRDSPRTITKQGFSRPGPRDKTKANLLLTCRATYSEALDLLFRNTVFKLDTTRALFLFLRNIGPVGRQRIRSLDVTCGQREDAVAFALLGSCERLRSLTIRLARPRLLFPMAPLWVSEGVACLLALSGLEEVRFGAGCGNPKVDLCEEMHDAAVLRRDLMREKGQASGVREVDGVLDL
jgi:hypothetical protein